MKALVTGGGGLIGRPLVGMLCTSGHEVCILARNRYREIEALGAQSFVGDICDPETVETAMEGVDVVFHLAARLGTWGDPAAFMAVNRDATKLLLDAARRAGAARFIHASTPSVVGYADHVENGSNSMPYAKRHLSPYAASKAAGETCVLAANTPGFATVALRPHVVFGPGDKLTVQKLIDGAQAGKLRIIGDGSTRVDVTYSENAAWAFMDAAEALTDWQAPCAGRAYFIGNGAPVEIWEFMNSILADSGLPEIKGRIQFSVAYALGWLLERTWSGLKLKGEPPVTRFMACALARSHWYDPAPAERDLGYIPRIPVEEGRKEVVDWIRSVL
ncbi:MAG: NAD-dependent epimerase/dehydratase family protein [Pseudomonadota bacterium]